MSKISLSGSQGLVHKVAERAHLVYFGAVFVEGHGWYAMSAGVCLLLGVAYEAAGLAGVFGAVVLAGAAGAELAEEVAA